MKKINEIERKIVAKMGAIKRKEVTPKDSGIGVLFSSLRTLDLPLYESLVSDYKKVLEGIK